ncbi:MAG TPA: FtsX-like permease family protein, partial [Thermoanaerobaculia bacterium]|nr:FtsX-like permease family protein [Thermoanaerobaculia bacterium]
WLRPSKGLSNADSVFFPAEILGELRRFNFIAAADPVRGREVLYGDDLVTVGSGDFSIAAKFGDLPMVAPRSAAEAFGNASRIGGVFVSESFSIKFKKNIGDLVTIPTADSPRSFSIVGIYRDYSNDRGVVVMDRAQYVRLYRDATINTIAVFLKPGTDPDAARRELERSLGPRFGAFAVMNADIRREVMRIFDQTFAITYALLGIAIAVAVLGIVNTLSALILERRRELALLRVAGLTQREVGTMLVLESSILGVVATVAGTVMGYVLSLILIFVINRQSFGWTIEFHVPAGLIAVSLGLTFLAAALAGLVPARLAASIDISRAIKAE